MSLKKNICINCIYDPNLKIDWPEPITMISKQDSGWKNLREGVK